MEDKYKEIGNLLRRSIDADDCYYCPFSKRCEEIAKQEKNYVLCDAIRIKIIEEKLKEFDKNT